MSRSPRITRCALTFAIALMTMTGYSQAKGFRGRIIDSITGEPISGATVLLFKIDDPTGMEGLNSDDNGRFDSNDGKFADLYIAGSIIKINITATGYEPLEEIAVLAAEQQDKEYYLRRLDNKVQRVFHIQHRDPTEIYDVIRPLCTQEVGLSPTLRTITVVENPEVLDKIEAEIKSHDLPYRQIWLDVLLVKASGNTGMKPSYNERLEPIVDKLGKLFKFDRYEIIGQVNAMGMEGSSLAVTSDRPDDSASKAVFEVSVGQLGVISNAIRLENLGVKVYRPQIKMISTTINIPNGDMVILGASRESSGAESIIVVVSATSE